jgi:hypothetical protein
MPATADAVFEIITDLENLHTWLPRSVEVERYGPDLLRLWLHHGDRDEAVERRLTIDWAHLRVEWHSETTTSYTGVLRVLRISANRSVITVDLIGGAGMPAIRVDDWLDRALDALAAIVTDENSPDLSLPGAAFS